MNDEDSVLKRYMPGRENGDAVAPEGEEQVDDLGAFGWLRGSRERAVMLELRKKDGSIRAVPYGWLESADFNPSNGITLHVKGQVVRIRGRNLNAECRPQLRLFEGIARHRVPWIQEANEPAALGADASATLIDEILIN